MAQFWICGSGRHGWYLILRQGSVLAALGSEGVRRTVGGVLRVLSRVSAGVGVGEDDVVEIWRCSRTHSNPTLDLAG